MHEDIAQRLRIPDRFGTFLPLWGIWIVAGREMVDERREGLAIWFILAPAFFAVASTECSLLKSTGLLLDIDILAVT